MTPILRPFVDPRSIARFRRLAAAASLLVGVLTVASPVLGYTSKLICGQPTRRGRIKVSIIVMKDDGTPGYPPAVWLDVDSTWTAVEKAAFLRTEFYARLGLRDTLIALGRTAEIQFQGQNGWMIHSVNVIQDDSKEPDQVALGLPYPEQEAMCSLSGVASGRDVQGGQGFVALTVGGANVTVPTQPGMPAQVVEQALISRLNQLGIQARLATGQDFSGCYQGLPHDGSVIWFLPPDTTGFREEITDVGLSLDIAMAGDVNSGPPSSVEPGVAVSMWRLDVAPSIFSRSGVQVRYSAGEEARYDDASIEVIDVAGRRVCALLDGSSPATGTLMWDGRNGHGASIPGGVYFIRLRTPRGALVRRVVHVRD